MSGWNYKTTDNITNATKSSNDTLIAPNPSNNDDNIVKLIDELLSINQDSPLAKLNETTISDNNGGRISL